MTLLLSANAAAKRLGISRDRFRKIRRDGKGPRVWNPNDGRPMFSVAALEEWAASRDDSEPRSLVLAHRHLGATPPNAPVPDSAAAHTHHFRGVSS